MKDFEISNWVFWVLLAATGGLALTALGLTFAEFVTNAKGIY